MAIVLGMDKSDSPRYKIASRFDEERAPSVISAWIACSGHARVKVEQKTMSNTTRCGKRLICKLFMFGFYNHSLC